MSTLQTIGIGLVVIAFLLTKVWLLFTKQTGLAIGALGAAMFILDNPSNAA